MTREEQALFKPDEAAEKRGRARLRMALMLQMAMPGVPCIYYGDEAGMRGMADPFCRRSYPWGREQKDILDDYRTLTRARRESKALLEGGCAMRAYGESVFALLRGSGEESALLLLNRSESSQIVCVSEADFIAGPDAGSLHLAPVFKDTFTGMEIEMTAGSVRVVLSPLSAALLISCEAYKQEA